MPHYAALDVAQETTAICIVDESGRIIAENKVPTCPDAIGAWLGKTSNALAMERTGRLAVERAPRSRTAGDLFRCPARECCLEDATQQDGQE